MRRYLPIFLLALSLCLTVACAAPSEETGDTASTTEAWWGEDPTGETEDFSFSFGTVSSESPETDTENPAASTVGNESEPTATPPLEATSAPDTESAPVSTSAPTDASSEKEEASSEPLPETFPNEAESEGTKRY